MFIFWDGEECRDAGYCLFGASTGGTAPRDNADTSPTYLQRPYLRTADMLDLLLSVASENPGASHVWFNGDYDVNQILREVPWKFLITLRHKGKVSWRGYRLEHIPGKIFKVSDGTRSVRVDDCFSFFRSRFDKALHKWEIGSREILGTITDGKDNRDNFRYRDIDQIRYYWSWEVRLGCFLMEKIKSIAHGAGYQVTNWHGPGALAAYSLKAHGVSSLMKMSPGAVLESSLAAYAGGWFERFKMGRYQGDVYTYDINSAYVYAMSLLPDLAQGTWRHVRFRDRDQATAMVRSADARFGLFHYNWSADIHGYLASCRGIPFPLFHREANGNIRRPPKSSGWVWTPEAAELSAIPYAELTEAWIFEHDITDRPFAWVQDDYNKRLQLIEAGDPSEKILKWALASYYGRIAQRTGWNEETKAAPPFHQIEWAGWITSKCRGMIYRPAMESGKQNGLVSIDTDGIISTTRIPELENGTGTGLGQWKVEKFDELIYLQNGVYWLRGDNGWEEPKLRGIPKTRLHDPSVAMRALESGEPISFDRRGFTGYRQAMGTDRSLWRTWGDHPVSVDFLNCGGRVHIERLCRTCRMGVPGFAHALHDLAAVPARSEVSSPHRVPWLESHDESDARYRKMILAEEM
jgi:hypothetical protein